MGQIIKQENKKDIIIKTSVLLEKEESPKVGNLYCYDYDKSFIKVVDDKEIIGSKILAFLVYNFSTNTWIKREHCRVSERDLKSYYQRILNNIEDLLQYNTKIENNERVDKELLNNFKIQQGLDTQEESQSTTSLVSQKKDTKTLLQYADSLALVKNTLEEIKKISLAKVESRKREIERFLDKMDDTLCLFKKEIEKVMKAITLIEIYLGKNEEVFQITKGQNSSKEILNIRQLVLYMDEEMADFSINFLNEGGADYEDIEKFDEWLSNPINRDKVIPEEKCIVCFKPRRFDKKYSNDPMTNALLNKYNHITYILIRNGDNLYRIYSDNIYVNELVFPNREYIKKLMNSEKSWDKDTIENLEYRGIKFALLINSLSERTSIFEKRYDLFKIEESGINIIYDGEQTLSDGKLRFEDWLKEINKNIQEGSRIVYAGIEWESNFHHRFVRYYSDKGLAPELPTNGIYTVYKYNEKLTIRYLPPKIYGKVYKNRVSFIIDLYSDFIINYDLISEEEIEYYINNRIDRKNYRRILPILYELKNRLIKEREEEKYFVKLIQRVTNKTQQEVEKALYWWKNKNKWKRALSQDDEKAYRMIVDKLKWNLKD